MAATPSTPSTLGRPSRATVATLVASMLVFGCSNSLLSKYQDMQCVADCNTSHPKHYEQPIFQTLTMFVGETLCLFALIALRYQRSRQLRKSTGGAGNITRQFQRAKYDKLPTVDDSGVVLNDSEVEYHHQQYEERATQIASAGSHSTASTAHPDHDDTLIHSHKAVVGPDELVPGVEDPVPAEEETLKGTKNLLMWLPAIFDICGTTLMNVGLLWVPVSVYQMLRGALVLWVGLFSVFFLRRRLAVYQWTSLFIVMLGVAVVGLSNSIYGSKQPETGPRIDVGKAVIGALLVLFAQIFTASQFVIEEKIMTRYSVEPLKAVGLEGIFGVVTTALLMPILYFTVGHAASQKDGYFDIPAGFSQTVNHPKVFALSILIACSIAFFNFSGLAVTKSVSATARSLIDTCRTIGIWAVSLLLGWEHLALLQIVGFALLVYGTLCFNDVISLPTFAASKGSSTPHNLSSSYGATAPTDNEEGRLLRPAPSTSSSSRPGKPADARPSVDERTALL